MSRVFRLGNDAVIGVDAGGTTTRAAAVAVDGTVLGTGRAGGGNPTARGAEAAADAVVAAVAQALPDGATASRVVVAHAGERLPAYAAGIAAGLSRLGVAATVEHAGDLDALFAAGTAEGDGLALIAGTGAIGGAFRDGRLHRVLDGTGWLLGDAGSGFWTGHRVARAAVDDLDGGASTSLTAAVVAALDLTDDRADDEGRPHVLRELVSRLYAERPVDLARLAPLAFAQPDDPVARGIVREAVAALAALLERLRTAQPEGTLVLGGSVLVHGVLRLPADVSAPLLRLAGRAVVAPNGLVGAAVLALRAAAVEVDDERHAALVRALAGPVPAVPAPPPPLPAVIREPRLQDTAAVYRICFETGPAPDDPERTPELLGHVYAGPYLAFAPEWCRVVADVRGVAGYLLAVPSTRDFARWATEEWWPPLLAEHPQDAPGLSSADRAVVARFRAMPDDPDALLEEYPAHLHIDFLPRARGRGFARMLIDDLCDRLAAAGVPGVHLGVDPGNTNAIGLYRHLGFIELRREPDVLWLGRRLPPPSAPEPARQQEPPST